VAEVERAWPWADLLLSGRVGMGNYGPARTPDRRTTSDCNFKTCCTRAAGVVTFTHRSLQM